VGNEVKLKRSDKDEVADQAALGWSANLPGDLGNSALEVRYCRNSVHGRREKGNIIHRAMNHSSWPIAWR
jgi:hypothetical protein